MNGYAASEDARQTAKAFEIAYGRTLWRKIGLAEPEAGWDEKAKALVAGVNHVLVKPPAEEIKVAGAWQEIAQTNDQLAGLEAEPVVAFLKQRLFHKEEKLAAEPSVEIYPAPVDPPLFKGAIPATAKPRKLEWFGYWLFSRQGMAIKGGVVVALLIAGWLGYQAMQLRQARDGAYAEMTQALNAKDYPGVIASADEFLRHPSFLGEDSRQQEVLDLRYDAQAIQKRDQAMAGIEAAFAEKDYEAVLAAAKTFGHHLPRRLPDDRQQQVTAYQQDAEAGIERNEAFEQLEAAWAGKDYPNVVIQADRFLDHPPVLEANDVREAQVLEFKQLAWTGQDAKESAYEQIVNAADTEDFLKLIEGAEVYLEHSLLSAPEAQDLEVMALYRAAFVRWFARLDGEPDEVALAHVDRYRELVIR
jgi:hypothetical protein